MYFLTVKTVFLPGLALDRTMRSLIKQCSQCEKLNPSGRQKKGSPKGRLTPFVVKCRVAESNHGHEDFQSYLFKSRVIPKRSNNQSIRNLKLKTGVLSKLVLIGVNWHQF